MRTQSHKRQLLASQNELKEIIQVFIYYSFVTSKVKCLYRLCKVNMLIYIFVIHEEKVVREEDNDY